MPASFMINQVLSSFLKSEDFTKPNGVVAKEEQSKFSLTET
jgi:hypothetical protein